MAIAIKNYGICHVLGWQNCSEKEKRKKEKKEAKKRIIRKEQREEREKREINFSGK
jgi:hypothetical protein